MNPRDPVDLKEAAPRVKDTSEEMAHEDEADNRPQDSLGTA